MSLDQGLKYHHPYIGMFSNAFKNLAPYIAGEQPRDKSYIKLNTNENPYPPPESFRKGLAAMDVDRLKLYPDPLCLKLRKKLGDVHGIPQEMIFTSNGSDEALSFCFYAFFDTAGGNVLFPDITYSFYPVYCNFYGLSFRRIPLNADFTVSLDGFLDEAGASCGVIFPNPNAPTGMYLELTEIEAFLKAYPSDKAVVIDEAYIDFGGESALPLIKTHPNLVVVRTFSKGMSLAGLRIGYVIASPDVVDALFAVKDSFNSYPLDYISQELACAACDAAEFFKANNIRIIDTRERFSKKLRSSGWTVPPSRANFVFASKEGLSGKEIYNNLRDQGILVRHFDKDRIRDFVRITIGTPEDMDTVADVLCRL